MYSNNSADMQKNSKMMVIIGCVKAFHYSFCVSHCRPDMCNGKCTTGCKTSFIRMCCIKNNIPESDFLEYLKSYNISVLESANKYELEKQLNNE